MYTAEGKFKKRRGFRIRRAPETFPVKLKATLLPTFFNE